MSESHLSFGTGRQLAYIDYLDALADFFILFKDIPGLKDKLQLAQTAVKAVNQGDFPPTLHDMAVTETDIAATQAYVLARYPQQPEQGNALWEQLREALEQVDYCLQNIRDEFIEDFNLYAYLTPTFLEALSEALAGKATLEIMAGQGYLSAGLRALRPDQTIIATDNQDWQYQPVDAVTPVTLVENLDALAAIDKYGNQVEVILMSWAPDTSDIDWQVLQKIRQEHPEITFLVIGEFMGATDSEIFWQSATLNELEAINATRPPFDLIDEKIYRVF